MSPTVKDVADQARVSVATVSHVINGTRYVSPELTERVEQAIQELDYHPNKIARSLKTTKTQTIGLVVSDITNPFFAEMVRGVEDAIMEQEHGIIIFNTDEGEEREKRAIDVLLKKRIDGFIVAPTGKQTGPFETLVKKEVPLTFVDRKLDEIEVDAVLSRNHSGTYQATEHLLRLGHKSIGIVVGLDSVSTTNERLSGYQEALKDFGIDLREELVAYGCSEVDESREAVRSLLRQNDVSAIFATNNMMTIGTIQAVDQAGLDYPEDISIVGFDNSERTNICNPKVTAIVQQPYRMGQIAAELLFDHLNGKDTTQGSKEVLLSTDFVVGESSKEVKG